MSARLLSESLWPEITRLAAKASQRKAAIAYCTEDKLHMQRGDVLVCDASDGCIKAGSTSAKLLALLLKTGVKLYSVPGLHAKVISFGNCAVIGSANMSLNAETGHRIEASVVTDSPQIVAQVEAFIQSLVSQATPLKLLEITRLRALPVEKRQAPARRQAPPEGEVLTGGRTWFVSVRADIKLTETETDYIDKREGEADELIADDEDVDSGWIRMVGKSKFRDGVAPGDTIIEAWRQKRTSLPERVTRYHSVLLVDHCDGFTLILVKTPRSQAEDFLSWNGFLRLAKQAELSFLPKANSARPVSADEAERLFALWPK